MFKHVKLHTRMWRGLQRQITLLVRTDKRQLNCAGRRRNFLVGVNVVGGGGGQHLQSLSEIRIEVAVLKMAEKWRSEMFYSLISRHVYVQWNNSDVMSLLASLDSLYLWSEFWSSVTNSAQLMIPSITLIKFEDLNVIDLILIMPNFARK